MVLLERRAFFRYFVLVRMGVHPKVAYLIVRWPRERQHP